MVFYHIFYIKASRKMLIKYFLLFQHFEGVFFMQNNKTRSIYKTLKYLTEALLPMLFWLLLIFGFDEAYIAILTVISALIHELGHISALIFFDKKALIPKGHISGFRIKTSNSKSYKENIIVLLLGPLFNLITYLLLLPFCSSSPYLSTFAFINLFTALSNLLPVESCDGYSALYEYFSYNNSSFMLSVLDGVSFLISVIATFFALYLLYFFGVGYWVFGMYFVILVGKLRKMCSYSILRE